MRRPTHSSSVRIRSSRAVVVLCVNWHSCLCFGAAKKVASCLAGIPLFPTSRRRDGARAPLRLDAVGSFLDRDGARLAGGCQGRGETNAPLALVMAWALRVYALLRNAPPRGANSNRSQQRRGVNLQWHRQALASDPKLIPRHLVQISSGARWHQTRGAGADGCLEEQVQNGL